MPRLMLNTAAIRYTASMASGARASSAGGTESEEAAYRVYDGDPQMVGSSSIRVHQHAANVKKRMRRRPPLETSLQPHAWGARALG
jgi:hypothetical protein